ncbi:zinc finger CCCH domain-containing protein 15-like [Saccoglossus kowalevskii]|uniref:Zinc finger CCCH domain-containing protein 15-like n=1 Tax=Saccoglossus kowalevskii TaxID=10224 RepID=A0ABM0H0V1_SACKO|nr:PREDICTED: zinc finger CCCH domain-containing protein 15-like [Saccoglossus kowalevskii]
MPPKKQQGSSKKNEQKKKEKVIEDKTFGLKNKKGAKQQAFIKNVTHQVKFGGQKSARQLAQLEEEKFGKKDQKKKEQDELNALFKPVEQKVSKGVDPKSVVCAFFKQGQCKKGEKCKFSHDLTIERKSEKRSLYVDARDDDKAKDTMDSWDQEKLQQVIDKKHAEQESKKPKTEIVCKFFLQAIEDCKYGWFWSCPNGTKCMYRHALPPGFVLKSSKKKEEDDNQDQITLEELIEEERAKIGANHAKITLESFLEWKRSKLEQKKEKFNTQMKKKKEDFKQGKSLGISGREVFEFKPELVDADDEGADDIRYIREEDDEEEKDDVEAVELTLEALAASATQADSSGITSRKSQQLTNNIDKNINTSQPSNQEEENNKLDEAAALPPSSSTPVEDPSLDGVQIDEQLFTDDVAVDEQLFDAELDEELDDLDLED